MGSGLRCWIKQYHFWPKLDSNEVIQLQSGSNSNVRTLFVFSGEATYLQI